MSHLPNGGRPGYGWTSTRKKVLALVAPMVYGETAVVVHGPATFVDSRRVPCDQVSVRISVLVAALGSPAAETGVGPLPVFTIHWYGRLTGVDYHITGHVLMNIGEVGAQFERHEYFLPDQPGGEALLVSSLAPNQSDWVLFTPMTMARPLTPVQAAAVNLRQVVTVGGLVVPVKALFSATVRETEFHSEPELAAGETLYGFAGQRDSQYLLVRWNALAITCLSGHSLSSHSVLTAFGPAPGR